LLLLAALLTAAAGAAQPAPVFRAGAALADITPALGTSINGGMRDQRAAVVHDRLHVRCLVLDDGRARLAFAVVDSCMVPREVTEAARRRLEREAGLPGAHLLVSATHSHSTGTCTGVFQSEPDAEYPGVVEEGIVTGVRRAVANLAPARVGWGSGRVPEEVFNRRFRMKPGTIPPSPLGGIDQVRMNPGAGNPDILEPAGPVDPELSILSVVTPAGRPVALLANYGLHYVGGVGPGHLSADYFGAFAARVGELLEVPAGAPFVGIMTNGASGDVNNVDVKAPRVQFAPYEKIRQVADRVAREAVRVHGSLRHADSARLGAATADLSLGVRKPGAADLARARELLARAPGPDYAAMPEIYARETLLLAAYPDEVPVRLQALRVGDLTVSAIPCEVFADIGLELKARSRRRPHFTVSLANGYNGYLPTPEHHALGGYETWRARSSYLEVQASRKIVEALEGLLDALPSP